MQKTLDRYARYYANSLDNATLTSKYEAVKPNMRIIEETYENRHGDSVTYTIVNDVVVAAVFEDSVDEE